MGIARQIAAANDVCGLIAPPKAQAIFCRRRHQPRRPPPAKIRPGRPAPARGPGTAVGAKLVSVILKSGATFPLVVRVKAPKKPSGAFPEPKRLKSPQGPLKHVPHGPPGVDCPTSCVVKSNVAPSVDQAN